MKTINKIHNLLNNVIKKLWIFAVLYVIMYIYFYSEG